VLAALLSLLVPVFSSAAENLRELDASLIWSADQRVYLVPGSNEPLEVGLVLELRYRKKAIATARVSSLSEAVVVADLLSGSLQRAKKKLDRVRVFALAAPSLEVPTLLRVGLPSPERQNLLFSCVPNDARLERPPSVFRLASMSPEGYLLVRVAEPHGVPWPDTLSVRWFEEVADQEIALERGELDVAVFWPGEPTDRMRDGRRWGFAEGERARGVIVAMWPRGEADADPIPGDTTGSENENASMEAHRLRFAGSARLADWNQQMFRGDLAPWLAPRRDETGDRSADSTLESEPPRFTVDLSFPGWRAIERFLNRGAASDAPVVRIAYVDEPATHATPHIGGETHIEPLFIVRCPLAWALERSQAVEAIGAPAWVELLNCEPASHGP